MKQLEITTIILTYNEEIHIRRCLDNVCPFSKKVYVIDSPSDDRTVEICGEFDNVEVVVHKYPGTQAEQLNWALNNLEFSTEWILRVDADEYLSEELISEIENRLPYLPDNITGIILPRWHFFLNKLMDFDAPAKILRLFRTNKGTCENRLMDEYIQLNEGQAIEFKEFFYDHTLASVAEYCRKHVNYATREAVMQLDEKYALSKQEKEILILGNEANKTRKKKAVYSKLPLFWRAFAYFIFQYIFKGAFFKGRAGFVYVYIQTYWYRTLVDSLIYEIESNCIGNPMKMRDYINKNFNISL